MKTIKFYRWFPAKILKVLLVTGILTAKFKPDTTEVEWAMKKFVTILFFILLATNVWAEELVIAIADWPPYEYIKKDGTASGLNVTIVQAAANRLGIEVKFVSYPWSRCLQYVKTGKVDGILSLYRTTKREKFLYFVPENISVDENVLFTYHKNNYIYAGNLENISGKTVVVARNNYYGEAFDKANFIIKYSANNTEQIIRMIAGDRYPLGISSKLPLVYSSNKLQLRDKLKILSTPVSSGDLYLGFTKAKGIEYKDLAIKMAQAVKIIKKTEYYKNLLDGYEL